MITLYTFGPFFGLPDPSPFVMKGEMLLKLSGLPYQTNTRGFSRAPKGKLPYIDDDGTLVADSTLIRLHLEKKHGIDFDRALSARERGTAWAVDKMLEDHLYWVMVYWRWLNDANFERGPKAFFKRAPAIIRPLVSEDRAQEHPPQPARPRHRAALGSGDDGDVRARHRFAVRILGDNRYFLGDEPCGADATVFAFVAGALTPRVRFAAAHADREAANLVAYRDRMMAEYFPDFAKG